MFKTKGFLFSVLIAALLFISCNQPVGPETKEKVTVFLFLGDNSYIPISIDKGSTIPSDINTDFEDHNFLFWSTSKASYAEAVSGKIDSNTPINQNMILYGIYAPKFSPRFDPDVSLTNIPKFIIYYEYNNVFVCNNNECFLNISIIIKQEDRIIKTIPITTQFTKNKLIKENLPDNDYYYYAKLDLPIPTLPQGEYSISITNGTEECDACNLGTDTKAKFTVNNTPVKAENITITTSDSLAKLNWDLVLGSSYTVNVKKDDSIVATKTNCVNSASFYGLDNNTTYTFEVITENSEVSDNIATETKTLPAITPDHPDWVFAMYMDGDNNLHDPIYQDLNEVEFGLWKLGKMSNKASVKAIALWDGWTGDANESPYWKTGPGSYLYELGPEESPEPTKVGENSWRGSQVWGNRYNEYLAFNNLSLCDETKNLSYTAKDWLLTGQDINTINEYSHGEINMGSKETLINFLNWIKAHYEPNKGIILQFSNHGGGPRNAPQYAVLPNGSVINIEEYGRKALCWDENSNNDFLRTKDVSDALETTSFTDRNTLSMILMDVCLGASIEDAYQFKDYADYLVASPNTIPGTGMDYIALMEAFTNDATAESIGKKIVSDYAHFYSNYLWDSYAKKFNFKYNTYQDAVANGKAEELELEYAGIYGVPTLTCINLSKIEAVASNIFNLANTLNSYDTTDLDKVEYLLNFRKDNLSWLEQKYINTTLTYKGSYNWLYDVGRLADAMVMGEPEEIPNEVKQLSDKIKTSLQDAIVSSWRDTRLTQRTEPSLYSFLNNSDNYYGLTIAGYRLTQTVNGNWYAPGTLGDWYATDLKFGEAENQSWYKFLKKLMPLSKSQ